MSRMYYKKVGRFPTEKLFLLHFKSLPFIVEEELLVLIFKIINNLLKHNYIPTQLHSLHTYDTRRRSHYNIEFFNSELRKQNVYFRGFQEFNKLPSAFRNETNIKKFKDIIKEYLKEKHLIYFTN